MYRQFRYNGFNQALKIYSGHMAYVIVIRNGTNANDVEMNMNSPKNILKTKQNKKSKMNILYFKI